MLCIEMKMNKKTFSEKQHKLHFAVRANNANQTQRAKH